MTYQIKSVFTDQHIVKRADQPTGFDLGLRHHVVHQRNPLTMNGCLNHHGAMAKDWPLLHVDML
ncbi:hypothetical protein D3C79_746090 [compost metagenome]